jgi:hypothetical protein
VTAEHERMHGPERERWSEWGAYVPSRCWGTRRESRPQDESFWQSFPFEEARSRAYRWGEDGIAGFCRRDGSLTMSLAFWNGRDPFLKERFFGLTNDEGNHGEDVKEYYWFLEALPSYSYVQLLYKYPVNEFPYARLVRENARRGQHDPEFELIDAVPNEFFDLFIEYAKDAPDDILCRIRAVNRSPRTAALHVLPHLISSGAPLRLDQGSVRAGAMTWSVTDAQEILFTDNRSNDELLSGGQRAFSKDGIDYAIVRGQRDRINPEASGTRCAAHCRRELQPGEEWTIHVRLCANFSGASPERVFARVQEENAQFYASVHAPHLQREDRLVQRRALAGLVCNQLIYKFDVAAWLDEHGTPDSPYTAWRHWKADDIVSLADVWEYPWLAAWDLAFQLTTLCLVDAPGARRQMLALLSDRYLRSDGALPGSEGDPDIPQPPVHAWSVWHIYHSDPQPNFLREAFPALERHFAWWLQNFQPRPGLFNGGFLGKDNISLLDRQNGLPSRSHLLQADATGWMAMFAVNMIQIAIELEDEQAALRYLNQLKRISKALARLWDGEDQFFYDTLVLGGRTRRLKARSFAGLVPWLAVGLVDPTLLHKLPRLRRRLEEGFSRGPTGLLLLSPISAAQAETLLATVLDPAEFLAPFGLRSLSRVHERNPAALALHGTNHELRYEPGLPSNQVQGGNSNWRGPVWAPVNQLLCDALRHYEAQFPEMKIRVGRRKLTLREAGEEITVRLASLFKPDENGRIPARGDNEVIQEDKWWREFFWFSEWFHPETGEGLGSSHQNGWTAVIAKLLQHQGGSAFVPGSGISEPGAATRAVRRRTGA